MSDPTQPGSPKDATNGQPTGATPGATPGAAPGGEDRTVINPAVGQSSVPPSATTAPTPPEGDDEDKKWRIAFLIIGLLILLLIIGIVIALIVNSSDDKKSTTTTTSSTTTTIATTTTASTTTAATTTAASTTARPTTTASTKPVITGWSVTPNPAPCTGGTQQITASWSTQRADSVTISIDGPGIYATYGPSGSTVINFPCDGNPHTYTLTAKGATESVTQTISVSQS